MTKNEFTLLYAIRQNGMQTVRSFSERTGLSAATVSRRLAGFRSRGLTDENGITEAGERALVPYRVDNAIIMAAGLSSRFVPLSLEKPKGLLNVRGEILIERQIEQLHAAGIRKIVLILGYRSADFLYLAEKYEGITIVVNPLYDVKNNPYTLYCAKEHFGNSYICSSDDYFAVNPFTDHVYQSYYAAIRVKGPTNEWYMTPDAKGNIKEVVIGGGEGEIMLGHVYWDRAFSGAMLSILEADQRVGQYDQALWETILKERVASLPPMEIKVYPEGSIFEFDSLDELRAFDPRYVDDTQSRIVKEIAAALGVHERDITGFLPVKDGSKAVAFTFTANGTPYLWKREPGGTDAVITPVRRQ
jgi:CTP:phosphocholine cytidylyltransferase-like protein